MSRTKLEMVLDTAWVAVWAVSVIMWVAVLVYNAICGGDWRYPLLGFALSLVIIGQTLENIQLKSEISEQEKRK